MVNYESAVSVSDGVTVDTTPPVSQFLLHTGQNLLQNPSFETSTSDIDSDNINATNVCALSSDYVPDSWTLEDDSCATRVSSSSSLPLDGSSFLFIRGNIMQTLSNLVTGELYRLDFYVSHILMSSSVIVNKEGFVKFGGDRHVYLLYNKAYRKDGQGGASRDIVTWQRHTYYFVASNTEVNLTMGSVDSTTGIFLDHVKFEQVQTGSNASIGETVPAHFVYVHSWGSVHGSWSFLEDVSHITEYIWAIGK